MIFVHPNIITQLIAAVDAIMQQGQYADKYIPRQLHTQQKWGSKDRKYFASIAYDCIRNYNYYIALLKTNNHDTSTENLVQVSIQNLGFVSKIENIPTPKNINIDDYRFPQWLLDLLKIDYPTLSIQDFASLDKTASVYIRTNTLKSTPTQLAIELASLAELMPVINYPEAFEVIGKNNLSQSKAYLEGRFEFQDIGSQHIGHYVAASPNDIILDLCAGAGGKSLHLAALTHNRATILATDFAPKRMEQLALRAKKANAKSIQILDYNTLDNLQADIVLIDAPCSGTGTLRRQADAKWKLTPQFVDECIAIQYDLLHKAIKLIKPNGKIVYATCSVLHSEGEMQIEKFLAQNSDFELVSMHRTDCFHQSVDGFFMVTLKRK